MADDTRRGAPRGAPRGPAWLLPMAPRIARLAMWLYYRIRYTGPAIPSTGPVLLVANHPNALIDPAVVMAAARRPVRLLAKSPLFDDRALGWLVRAVGSIPVYRQQDDPAAAGRNAEMFTAVAAALHQGAAIALFPEGKSHDDPQLADLKTGAARIALQSGAEGAFPIVPVGLAFEDKAIFRSAAQVLVGAPVAWDDLAGRSPEDAEAVRTLTTRIAEALREVTLNLHSWEDAAVVACAEAVYSAEVAPAASSGERHVRRLVAARLLTARQREGDVEVQELAEALRTHAMQLEAAGVTPGALARPAGRWAVARWGIRALRVLLLLVVGVVGVVLWYPPYRVVGAIVSRLTITRDVQSTYKLFGALLFFALWLALLTTVAGVRWGWEGVLLCLVLLPLLGVAALTTLEQGARIEGEARGFLARRPTRTIATLRRQQREIAGRLQAFLEAAGVAPVPPRATPD